MGLRWFSTLNIFRRYATVSRHAWRERDQYKTPRRLPHESAFLPATLELQETPVSPAPRIAMLLLIGLVLLTIGWATVGRMDVVATARGRIVPSDRTKTVQPIETATVTAIRVKEGQAVRARQVLVELDATPATADVTRLREDWTTARLQAHRSEAFLRAIDSDGAASLPPLDGVDAERLAMEDRLLQGQVAEYQSKQARLDAEITRRDAELHSLQEVVEKLVRTLPIVRQAAESYRQLYEEQGISKIQWMDREQARIEQEQELATQRSRMQELQAARQESLRQKDALVAETRRAALDTLHDGDRKAAAAQQELVKARQRERLTRLVSPVEGTVQQLAVHTVGGVVTPAQPLMIVVPKDDPVEIEAFVENKDVGFVHPGQVAEIKVETFPYTKHGTVPATVVNVSTDAVQDEKRGLVFTARLALGRATIQVNGSPVRLTPGMAVTAEIKTDRRRVIEYFLSPLLQYGTETFRER
ncbi:MAG TPA: HlyD family type I secretion periplasmic adaptor subunit [Candidatus Methylomirabilis sp.]|nr:HlyD family type I secretion periplasmic adaptor subunit [Candidatus Methylomirabilis sp.]